MIVLGYHWWMWLLLIVPASFMILGAIGAVRALLQSGTSAERRAALANKAAQLDLFDDAQERGVDYPTLPRALPVSESPGTRLAYRPPADATSGWLLAGVIAVCVIWNGIVAWFTVTVFRDFAASQPGWWIMGLVLVPFVATGGLLFYLTGRHVVRMAGMGSTRVELSAHPLYPGDSYELLISQTGHMTMTSLEVSLVCEEIATYRQGTDTRTERLRTHEQSIYQRADIHIEPGMAFEDRCALEIPPGVMHSFQSVHNEVKWKLIVSGQIVNRGGYQRQFPLVVYPALEPAHALEAEPAINSGPEIDHRSGLDRRPGREGGAAHA